MPVTNVTHDTDALTLTINAEFAAPRERIWQVYSDPKQLEKIWGPPTYPATFVDHNLKPGGRMNYFMTSPEGDKHAGWWEIVTVDEPSGFTFKDGFADADFNPIATMPVSDNDFTFVERDGSTHATYVSTYATAEALQQVLEMGIVEGATGAINQIDGLVAGA